MERFNDQGSKCNEDVAFCFTWLAFLDGHQHAVSGNQYSAVTSPVQYNRICLYVVYFAHSISQCFRDGVRIKQEGEKMQSWCSRSCTIRDGSNDVWRGSRTKENGPWVRSDKDVCVQTELGFTPAVAPNWAERPLPLQWTQWVQLHWCSSMSAVFHEGQLFLSC